MEIVNPEIALVLDEVSGAAKMRMLARDALHAKKTLACALHAILRQISLKWQFLEVANKFARHLPVVTNNTALWRRLKDTRDPPYLRKVAQVLRACEL